MLLERAERRQRRADSDTIIVPAKEDSFKKKSRKLPKDTGKYMILFKGDAHKLGREISIGDPNKSPQGPVYVKKEKLIDADTLEEALEV